MIFRYSDTCDWEAPIPKPEVSEGEVSLWDEEKQEWIVEKISDILNIISS